METLYKVHLSYENYVRLLIVHIYTTYKSTHIRARLIKEYLHDLYTTQVYKSQIYD